MKKKIILALCLAAIATLLFALTANAAEPVETWNVSESGSSVYAYLYENSENSGKYDMVITGNGNMKGWSGTSTLVPWSSYKSSIISVTIEDGVKSIGEKAFYNCSAIRSVSIPNSVTSIGRSAFYDCDGLSALYIPTSVTSVGHSAFYSCGKLTIYCQASSIPSGWNAFYNPHKCPVVTGHTHTYDRTTELCVCGAKVNYVEKWDISKTENDSVFAYLYTDFENEYVYTLIIRGTGNMKNWTDSSSAPWYSYCTEITSVTIEQGVTSIGDYAFFGCYYSLTSIVIPEGVTSIGDYAFYDCAGLTSIVIPEGVTSIGDYAFQDCSSLTSVVIHEGVTSIGDYAFSGCYILTSVVIHKGVTSIGDYVFYGCSGLTSIVIPEGVTSIGDYAFAYCSRLTSVVIHKGVTYIGSYAFEDCESLTSIVIPEGVTSIGNYAFSYCSSLTSIVIPEGVTSIGDCAFADCSSLISIVIPEGVTNIGDGAFAGCSSLTSVVIHKGVTSIGDGAFSYCYNLTSIIIPESVTSIGESAFSYCYSLTSIVIPEGVTYIGDLAFYDCSKLVEVYNKSSLNITKGSSSNGEVGYYALNVYTPSNGESKIFTTSDGFVFYDDGANRYLVGYTGMETDITLPSTCNGYGYEIYKYAFYKCYSLTSIVIPEGVTSIGSEAFYDCSSLTSIVIPESVTSIGYDAFFYCSSLTSIVIPEGVTSIGSEAFYRCSSLTSIVIPESVTSIGYYAFYDCSKLTIYCEAASQPSDWNSYWNLSNRPVVWGYFDENACLSDVFTFKGYSFDGKGGFAVGFAIDYDALAKYEAKTGKTVQIGVVFAGYENLGGSQPLDEMGEAIALQVGKVVKADITEYGYKYYDFMLTGFDGSITDIGLVIAGYIFDGEAVKYVQANGMSDTVYGITYNEALNG